MTASWAVSRAVFNDSVSWQVFDDITVRQLFKTVFDDSASLKRTLRSRFREKKPEIHKPTVEQSENVADNTPLWLYKVKSSTSMSSTNNGYTLYKVMVLRGQPLWLYRA